MEEKLDRIIELLESINKNDSKAEQDKNAVMKMNAKKFVERHDVGTRIYCAVGKNAREWTVKEVYDNGMKIRNFGKKSLNKFRKIVDSNKNA